MNLDEYRHYGQNLYMRFAVAVAKLLELAIWEDGRFRLQHIQHRAKGVNSLLRRLEETGNKDTPNIEQHRKDLAGCRIIFYTNDDVTRFTQQSGILSGLFDVDWQRSKFHQPMPGEGSTEKLFQSFNFVVRLNDDRASLLEYREFEGLLCEIQVQTTLNHAWAEMAHDIVYKRPESSGFGSRELERIEKRLGEVMRRHLLKAGYMFQSIASDVQRLSEGKALFEADLLDAIVEAKDNNSRHTDLVRLKDSVLPNYDDLHAVYPDVLNKLKEAWMRAERTETVPFEGTVGSFRGYEPHQVTAEIAAIFTQYRYVNPIETYTLIRDLFVDTSNDKSKEQLIETAKNLAKHTMQVWQHSGPAVQILLAEELSKEPSIERFADLAVAVAGKILDPDIEGYSFSSDKMTYSHGAIVHSDDLAEARRKAIDVVATCAESVVENGKLLGSLVECLFNAGRMPHHGPLTPEIAAMTYSDLAYVIETIDKFVNSLGLSSLQSIESGLFQMWRWHRSLPEAFIDFPKVVDAHNRFVDKARQLRDKINEDEDYVVFKTIVGYQYFCPHMWDDQTMDFEKDLAVRNEAQEKLAESITKKSWPQWKSRIGYAAKVKSHDTMTFPPLNQFLSIVARRQPEFAFELLLDRRVMPERTIFPIANVLLDSPLQSKVQALFNGWIEDDDHLEEIARVIAQSSSIDTAMVQRTVRRAIGDGNQVACAILLEGAIRHYKKSPTFWKDEVFFPCLCTLGSENAANWIGRICHMVNETSLVAELTEVQSNKLLESMVDIPNINFEVETLLGVVASKYHKLVLDWFSKRISKSANVSSLDYEPIPFSFQKLHEVLQQHTEDVISVIREWSDRGDAISKWKTSRFLKGIYPNLEEPLLRILLGLVRDGDVNNLEFVASSIVGFEGRQELLPLLREILASDATTEKIESKIANVIHEIGVTTGEFGLAQEYQSRAEMLQTWLIDSNVRVSEFATRMIHEFKQLVAMENRRAQEQKAKRKLEYDEPLEDEGPPDNGDSPSNEDPPDDNGN